MKVLVTGHLGYVGAVMVPRLLAAGHEVVGLDTDLYAGCDFGPAPADVPFHMVDVRDVEVEHCRGFDAVIHLAALSNDPLGDLNSNITYDVNYHATVRLAECAKAAGYRALDGHILASNDGMLDVAGALGFVETARDEGVITLARAL